MHKIWFININGVHEGPFSLLNLKRDDRITPDTLVWKEGFSGWKRIRDVPELGELFKDDQAPSEKKPSSIITSSQPIPDDQIVLDLQQEPPYLFWILLALVLAYVLFELHWK